MDIDFWYSYSFHLLLLGSHISVSTYVLAVTITLLPTSNRVVTMASQCLVPSKICFIYDGRQFTDSMNN
jgi:hypothetical protein